MTEKQLQKLKDQHVLLAQFIIRLSAFYEGYSAELDTELQTLRSHLAGQPDFTLARVSMDKLERLFQGSEQKLTRFNQASIELIEQSVKSLQRSFAHDDAFKKHTAQLLTSASQTEHNLFALLKLCLNAIALYRQLPSTSRAESAPARSANQQSSAPLNDKLSASVHSELQQLLDTYSIKLPDNHQLADLRQHLDNGLSHQDLLQTCLIILRVLVKDSLSEATFSGKVIQSLHNALGAVNKDISRSITKSQDVFASRIKTDDDMLSQLSVFEDTVNETTSVESLRSEAQRCLQKMASTLTERQEHEQTEQNELMGLLQNMQTQLTTLEQQTEFYRRKLAEQVIASQTDPLTRLPNRQAYNERISALHQQAQATNTSLCLAVADIDHFKSINDKYGHAAGDKTLQIVGQQLKSGLTRTEFISRWGGEEFVMIFPATELGVLKQKLDRLRTRLTELPFKFKQEKVTITASFGGACFGPDDTADSVFERADNLLYSAKRSGRNCVVIEQDK